MNANTATNTATTTETVELELDIDEMARNVALADVQKPMAMASTRDDRFVDIDELALLHTPEPTKSYTPVPHLDVVELVHREAQRAGLTPAVSFDGEEFAHFAVSVARKGGAHMFGIASFEHPSQPGRNIAVGFRNSHLKDMALGVVIGQRVMVCSNLCFGGDVKALRRHTGAALEEFAALVQLAFDEGAEETARLDEHFAYLEGIKVSQNQGYSFLGRAMGHGVLSPRVATRAFEEWRNPSIEEHAARTGMGLYNAVTQGMKAIRPDAKIYGAAHRFILEQAGWQFPAAPDAAAC
ncbi:MAG: DUF945 domain-containing protein [Actinomycetales bacterium]|nr:DUF945 domain-containing protein [Actinomycetales bacterium]